MSSSFAATKNGVVPGRRAVSQLCPADPEPGGRGKAGSASDNPRRQSLRLGAMEATAASRAAAAAYPLPTAVPAGGYHPHHPTNQPVNRGVLTAALDAALVCLPPGADGQPACPDELAFTPVFYETLMLVRPQTPGPLRFAAFASGCSCTARWENAGWRNSRRPSRCMRSIPITACLPAWRPGATRLPAAAERAVADDASRKLPLANRCARRPPSLSGAAA